MNRMYRAPSNYGTQALRIADASILPRVTTGNTMAPSVVIGEQAVAFLREDKPVRERTVASVGAGQWI